MRSLKFRAWCEKIQYYFYDVAIYPNGVVARKSNALLDTLTEGETHWHELDNAVIEQYTGLKDKNGKEIYDGDIVLVANHGRTPYVAIYREGDCCFVANNEFLKDYIHLFKGLNQCYEVIGNIHENPELLEQEDAKN